VAKDLGGVSCIAVSLWWWGRYPFSCNRP